MKRREFVQTASWILATLGLESAGLAPFGQRYYQALAQPSRRKLALLVGINAYAEHPLKGCLQDLQLQKQLLVHRFGFAPEDVVLLTDGTATRATLESKFEEHLQGQASSEDLVLFHFSGYGRQLLDADLQKTTKQRSLEETTIWPGRALVLAGESPHLPLNELWSWMHRLPAEKLVTVLDTSFTYPGQGTQGLLRVRALPARENEASATRSAGGKGSATKPPGLVFLAADASQFAVEAHWYGFWAGLLSYTLTQNLWCGKSSDFFPRLLQRSASAVQQVWQYQKPQLWLPGDRPGWGSPKSSLTLDSWFSPQNQVPEGVDGAISGIDAKNGTATLWLGGLPGLVLENYGSSSVFSVVPQRNGSQTTTTQVQAIARDGLQAKVQPWQKPAPEGKSPSKSPAIESLQVGQLATEYIRVIPRSVSLTVALDTALQRIERVDATSAFSYYTEISAIVAGEQPADYLFSRVQLDRLAGPTTALLSPVQGSYALFSPAQELIPNTAGQGGEAIKTAVQRLLPRLKTLLAMKLLRLTNNVNSSRLGIRATLTAGDDYRQQVLLSQETRRVTENRAEPGASSAGKVESGFVSMPVGTEVQFQLENLSDRPVHFLFFGLNTNAKAIALCPFPLTASTSTEDLSNYAIQPGEIKTFPVPSSSYEWKLPGPPGLTETLLVCSRSPFKHAIEYLQIAQHSSVAGRPIGPLGNALEIAQAILQDLHEASRPAAQQVGVSSDYYAFDMDAWASFSFPYRLVSS
ncbi:caspase family protein [Geitlerinema sp. PCC 9228]|jgi:hypothetical protein|uniref:caspase family protein n=1 Tax=Geitlerinema sp. PCC 9228 TaxID=111611 RepID=UPI0008F98AFB|nr:caspase family protein [Geitlerinema sp. PCC 9228]